MIALKQKLTDFRFKEITTIEQNVKRNECEYYIDNDKILLFINTNTKNTFSKDIYYKIHSLISNEHITNIYIILDKTSTNYSKAFQILLLIGFKKETYYNLLDIFPDDKLNDKYFSLFKLPSIYNSQIEEIDF